MALLASRFDSAATRINTASLLLPSTAFVVAAAIVMGGGTREALWSDAVVQLLALALFALTIPLMFRENANGSGRLVIAIIGIAAAIGAYELVPLPPSIWTRLPGRETIAAGFTASGIDLPWLPVSLSPGQTWRSLLAVIPAIAVFAAVAQLGFRARRSLSLLLIALGLVSVLLGLAQLMQGPLSSLRFFPVTNAYSSVGFFANRNHYAALLYCLIPFVTAWVVEFLADRGPGRLLGVVVFLGVYVILLLGLGMALSRAGIALAVIATAASLLLFRGLEPGTVKRSLSVMGAAFLIALLLIVQYALFDLATRFSTDTLNDSRLDIARTTLTASTAFAPFGSGLGTFEPVYKMFETVDAVGRTYVNHAHDDWLELWLELGWVVIIPIVAFLTWFVRAAVRAWREPSQSQNLLDRALPPAATIVVTLLMMHSVVDYPLRTTAMSTVLAVACALLVPPHRASRAAPESGERKSKGPRPAR
jgi:O-antigen ligase